MEDAQPSLERMEYMQSVFSMCDSDGDGVISVDELRTIGLQIGWDEVIMVNVCLCVSLCVCYTSQIRAHTHARTCTYMYVHPHARTHTHTHTHTHTEWYVKMQCMQF